MSFCKKFTITNNTTETATLSFNRCSDNQTIDNYELQNLVYKERFGSNVLFERKTA